MDISVLKQISSINDLIPYEKKPLMWMDEKSLLRAICEKLIDIDAQLKILNIWQEKIASVQD